MTQFFIEIWGVVVALWNIGHGSARRILNAARWIIRTALLALLIWPLVVLAVAYQGQLGLTAIVAIAPIGVFFLLILIYPLVSGILAALPQGRVVWRYFLMLVFAEVCIGLYLTLVPVWNDPQLMALLAILASVLGMFLILKGMFGWQNKWATRFAAVLTLGIFVVTVIFFLGGRERIVQFGQAEVQRESPQQAGSAIGRVEEFTVNAGEEVFTVLVGPGTIHRVSVDKRWLAVSTQPDGKTVEYGTPAGSSIIRGTAPEGLLRVKGVEEGITTLRFERVR